MLLNVAAFLFPSIFSICVISTMPFIEWSAAVVGEFKLWAQLDEPGELREDGAEEVLNELLVTLDRRECTFSAAKVSMDWPAMVVVYLEPNVDLWMQEAIDVAAALRSFGPHKGKVKGGVNMVGSPTMELYE